MDKELIRVTDVIYDDDDDLVVTVVGRTQDGRRVAKDIYDTEPYLFVPEDAPDPTSFEDVDEEVLDVREGFESYQGEQLKQIVTRYPSDVNTVEDCYAEGEHFESDVVYERRCTADYGLSGYIQVPSDSSFSIDKVESLETSDVDDPIEPRISFVDIEVDPPESFYDDFAEDAPNEVQAVTAFDSYDEEYTLFCLDPDHQVEPGRIREVMEDHWGDHEDAEQYTQAEIVFKRFGDESSLLQDFVRYVQEKRPDVMTGWNYVDFDHEYLVNRIRDNEDVNTHALSDVGAVGGWQTSRYVPGMPAVDMMRAMQKILYGQKESWSLEYIAGDMLDVGKIEGEGNSYDEDRSMFMAYNIVDVQLCVALDEAQAVMQFWFQVSEICSIPIYSVGSTMKECEGYLFKHREDNEILPTTETEDTGEADGGFVMPASSGVKEWVGVTDLKSLYPSSIITCNISKETMTTDPEEADVVVPNMPLNYEEVGGKIVEDDIGWELGEGSCVGFTLDKEGILPKYLKNLFSDREELKTIRNQHDPESTEYDRYDNQQRAVKVIMNSFFGVSDNPYFRLSEEGLGDAITAASRFVQWFGVQVIESYGYDVIYGDTDSLMVSLVDSTEDVSKADVIDRGLGLEENLNSDLSPISDEFDIPEQHPFVDLTELPHNLPDDENHLWQYEFEKLYRRFFQPGSKKRYAGWIVWKEGKEVDDTDTVGLEAVRSDYPAVAATVQETFIEKVLKAEGFDELTEFVQDVVAKIRDLEYSVADIGIPSTINKPIGQYPNGPMPRGSRHVNKFVEGIEWNVGDDPWLIYVDTCPQGVRSTDVLALPWTADELPDGYQLDVGKHVEKAVRQPISSVVEETDYTWGELAEGKREKSVLGGGSGGGSPDFEDGGGNASEPDFGDDTADVSEPDFGGTDDKPDQNSAFDW